MEELVYTSSNIDEHCVPALEIDEYCVPPLGIVTWLLSVMILGA